MQGRGFFCRKRSKQCRISRPIGLTADPIEGSRHHALDIFARQAAQGHPIEKHIGDINLRHLRPKPSRRKFESLLDVAHACGSCGQPMAC